MTVKAIEPGAVLGDRYAIESRIALGGVGEVWAATDLHAHPPHNQVAVKTLRAFFKTNDEVRARFAREAELLTRIDSPHVCKLLDVQADDRTPEPFLVFERLYGDSLDRVLKGGKTLPFNDVHVLIDEIFAGLCAAHAVGVVHRDLKPANVFVVEEHDAGRSARSEKHVKLIDFGISKMLGATGGSLTTGTATLGSPQYMAPEQLGTAALADERCDTYAAATIAFRALTGTLPFDPRDALKLLAMKQRTPAGTLEEVTKRSWPPALQAFFDGVLARDREERPRTAQLTRQGWQRACAMSSGSVDSTNPADSSRGMVTIDEDNETPVLPRGARRW